MEAFRLAAEKRPGSVHPELFENMRAEWCAARPIISPHPIELAAHSTKVLEHATAMLVAAERHLMILGECWLSLAG